ncbi:DUF4811 domain-containing protein [Weissella sagaensis]|uniref:DUF4811 domain-containing protein n=1 Tax=Weissella sagaensis TaxID=2559928 RepID=UPI00214B2580|nr:DUF4811 domain-containing protein [Weissella sagaensis]
MILWIIVIAMILMIVSLLLINNRILRYSFGGLFMFVFMGFVIALSANMYNHYGMSKETTVQHKQIYSAAPANVPVGMLITKKIGNNHYIMMFKDSADDQTARVHFVPDKNNVLASLKKSANYKKINSNTAQVVTKTTKWQYNSELMSWLFKFKEEDHLVKITHTVEIPNNWKIVNK